MYGSDTSLNNFEKFILEGYWQRKLVHFVFQMIQLYGTIMNWKIVRSADIIFVIIIFRIVSPWLRRHYFQINWLHLNKPSCFCWQNQKIAFFLHRCSTLIMTCYSTWSQSWGLIWNFHIIAAQYDSVCGILLTRYVAKTTPMLFKLWHLSTKFVYIGVFSTRE